MTLGDVLIQPGLYNFSQEYNLRCCNFRGIAIIFNEVKPLYTHAHSLTGFTLQGNINIRPIISSLYKCPLFYGHTISEYNRGN